jgi:hypothetical protein
MPMDGPTSRDGWSAGFIFALCFFGISLRRGRPAVISRADSRYLFERDETMPPMGAG